MQFAALGEQNKRIAQPKLQIIGVYEPKLFIRTANEANQTNQHN